MLPRWKSHKIVSGDKIINIIVNAPGLTHPDDTGIRYVLACGEIIDVFRPLVARGFPGVGDYYVRYDDGYESWSPARQFEEGYERMG